MNLLRKMFFTAGAALMFSSALLIGGLNIETPVDQFAVKSISLFDKGRTIHYYDQSGKSYQVGYMSPEILGEDHTNYSLFDSKYRVIATIEEQYRKKINVISTERMFFLKNSEAKLLGILIVHSSLTPTAYEYQDLEGNIIFSSDGRLAEGSYNDYFMGMKVSESTLSTGKRKTHIEHLSIFNDDNALWIPFIAIKAVLWHPIQFY